MRIRISTMRIRAFLVSLALLICKPGALSAESESEKKEAQSAGVDFEKSNPTRSAEIRDKSIFLLESAFAASARTVQHWELSFNGTPDQKNIFQLVEKTLDVIVEKILHLRNMGAGPKADQSWTKLVRDRILAKLIAWDAEKQNFDSETVLEWSKDTGVDARIILNLENDFKDLIAHESFLQKTFDQKDGFRVNRKFLLDHWERLPWRKDGGAVAEGSKVYIQRFVETTNKGDVENGIGHLIDFLFAYFKVFEGADSAVESDLKRFTTSVAKRTAEVMNNTIGRVKPIAATFRHLMTLFVVDSVIVQDYRSLSPQEAIRRASLVRTLSSIDFSSATIEFGGVKCSPKLFAGHLAEMLSLCRAARAELAIGNGAAPTGPLVCQ